ncbi:hypothetical protein VTK73DRAFT_2199 [Phialemonium thermophilum]|uniref:Uncharacterized protein n=1 Tax=Phialemonium thermophilum TaxID=223376 RepID=A0ABR3Y225_9PEZI
MTDRDVNPLPGLQRHSLSHRPSDQTQQEDDGRALRKPDDAFSQRKSVADSAAGEPGARQSLPVDYASFKQKPRRSKSPNDDERRQLGGLHRSHKQRSSGGFLLSGPSSLGSTQETTLSVRRTRDATRDWKAGFSSVGPEKQRSHASNSSGGHSPTQYSGQTQNDEFSQTTRSPLAGRDVSIIKNAEEGHEPTPSPLDVDSAQIVSMALNLSQSRRLVSSRRVPSQHLSPKLSPLAESSVGGTLRQHLMQQRRISGRASPKPDALARGSTGQRVSSPLQTSFDQVHDSNYRYRFSPATLSRAQKAKDYLELLAQYRRLLELVPPLKPDYGGALGSLSRPTTSNGRTALSRAPSSVSSTGGLKLGREYNPLQYIRNRKVRARERQAIDSESQGFTDVVRVKEWVDEVEKQVPSRAVSPLGVVLPAFPAADAAKETSPTSNPLRVTQTGSKPKRPRVDWIIDPADMIADLYWLEQGDHKRLVEDRFWRRVFPQDLSVYGSLPQKSAENALTGPSDSHGSEQQDNSVLQIESGNTGAHGAKGQHDHVLSNAREKAHQKLHALKTLPHGRHGNSGRRDFLRKRRDSTSDSSDSDDSNPRRSRNETSSADGRAVLERQMMKMIAQEQRDEQLHPRIQPTPENNYLWNNPPHTERQGAELPWTPSRSASHGRYQSVAENSEADVRSQEEQGRNASSTQHIRQSSLETPQPIRGQPADWDTSQPTSPDIKPSQGNPFVPVLGTDLSPSSSRPQSPTRNPLSKVKSIFRERSRERDTSLQSDAGALARQTELVAQEVDQSRPSLEKSRDASPRRGSGSSALKTISKETIDSQGRSHRRTSSTRVRMDEASSGFRAFLKGPRIDGALRSGISKVGDLIWKRESDKGMEDDSSTSSDESETERQGRNRLEDSDWPSRPPSRVDDRVGSTQQTGKTYLNVMPSFVSASDSRGQLATPGQGVEGQPPSRPPSRRSSRFERLKPPKLDVSSASPTSAPPGGVTSNTQDFEVSDAESRKNSRMDAARAADARLNAVISRGTQRRFSAPSGTEEQGVVESGSCFTKVSKAEIVRLRALILSSGITAMEIDRRARRLRAVAHIRTQFRQDQAGTRDGSEGGGAASVFSWASIADFVPDDTSRDKLLTRRTSQTELYPLAAQVLVESMHRAERDWQGAADDLRTQKSAALLVRAETLRNCVREQSEMTRAAADEADEVSRDLVVGQTLKIKAAADVIEKLLRRRRRRFRWLRRAGWLALEWMLVGFMWYVWFVVVILRIFVGIGKGFVRGVRWLFWL